MPNQIAPITWFEDCRIGDQAVSRGRTITEADIVQFASITGDWNPIHCDAEFMRAHPVGERIAHGLLVLSVASGLLYPIAGHRLIPSENILFAGMDQVKFIAPVRIGDTLRMFAETIEARRLNSETGLVTLSIRMLNQRDELVMSMRSKFAVTGRRSVAQPS